MSKWPSAATAETKPLAVILDFTMPTFAAGWGKAHGLEVRVPFLGKRMLDLAARIPHRWKHPGRKRGKALLRTLLRQYLPEEITTRTKSGFGIPLDTSLGAGQRQEIETMLTAR